MSIMKLKKKLKWYYLLLIGAFFLILACSEDNFDNNTPSPAEIQFEIAQSSLDRNETSEEPNLIETQAQSINQFSIDLYHEFIAEESNNIFFSPYSITLSLGMIDACAKNNTKHQIREVLNVNLQGDDFHAALNDINLSLSDYNLQSDQVYLISVNNSWGRKGSNFKQEFLDLLAKYYGTGVNLLDFINEAEKSRQIINQWVKKQTNDKIQNLLPQGTIHSETRLVLTNVVYFSGSWLCPFDESSTQDEPFYLIDGSSKDVPLMWSSNEFDQIKLPYADSASYKVRVLDLPYQDDRLTMTLFLPDSGTFESFEKSLTLEIVQEMISSLEEIQLPAVRLPKFTGSFEKKSLKKPLQNLGITDAFFPGTADLLESDGVTNVQNILHNAYISVDEAGTEAVVSLASLLIASISDGIRPKEFIADRPFIYFIRDKVTETILFMGRVLDPTE